MTWPNIVADELSWLPTRRTTTRPNLPFSGRITRARGAADADADADAADVTELSKGRGQCKICGKICGTVKAARSHVKNIHLSGSIECTICGNLIKNKHAFAMHLLRKHQLRGVPSAYGKAVPASVVAPLDVGLEYTEPKVELL